MTIMGANTHLPANGQLIPLNQYQALYSLIGTYYGGDGRTNFALPDLRGRMPVGMGLGPGLPNYPLGTMTGTPNITIPAVALPSHSHTATFTSTGTAPIDVQIPVSGDSGSNVMTPDSANNRLSASPVSGGGAASIWSGNTTSSVNIGGVTTTGGGGTGTVTVNPSGNGQSFPYMPPVTTLNYCIAVSGTYPSRP